MADTTKGRRNRRTRTQKDTEPAVGRQRDVAADDADVSADGEEPQSGTRKRGKGRDYTQRSVVRVCSILNMLQREVEGVTLTEIVEATGLAKPSAFRYMWTLERQRYVEKDDDGLYQLGLGFAGLQSRHLEALRERSHPLLKKLREEFDETSNLGLLDNDQVLYFDVIETARQVRLAVRPGHRDPVHSTALGKAIASKLPETQVREILLRQGMDRLTSTTITDIDDFMEELAKIREQGYAVDNQEMTDDGRCVAVPLLGTSIPAAISLSAPANRFPDDVVERAVVKLHKAADKIAPVPDEVDLSAVDDEGDDD